MTIDEILARVPGARLGPRGRPGGPPTVVNRVAPRADACGPGAVFVCVPGVSVDGHAFAERAVAHGASLVVAEHEVPVDVPQVIVDDARLALAVLAAALEGDPGTEMTMVGVTGTNGKTTCAYLLRSVLGAGGGSVGLIGTVEIIVGGVSEPTTHTTPDPVALQRLLGRMRDAGDGACVMEVSSHALAQSRVAAIPFRAALFTNLTQDHLDYHHDMENYFRAKRQLFARPSHEGPSPAGAANIDDPWGARLADELSLLGYGLDPAAEVTAETLRESSSGTWLRVRTPRGPFEISSRLHGEFNVLNLLGVVAVGELLGLAHDQVARGIAAVRGVPGRLEPIDAGQSFHVLVDYAHTPDALASVLRTVRGLAGDARVIVVFGCGGDRDRGKRPLMGYIATHLADVVIVTSDNPRSEDPEMIIEEIISDVADGRERVRVEPDRRRAIAAAIAAARSGDVVLIAGKGHERGQEIAGRVLPFDDRDVARVLLAGYAR